MDHSWPIHITAVVISLLQITCQYQQQTYYIKPANSSHCPANVSSFYCKDLATFVLESNQLLSPNTSLMFLPGLHLLTSNLQIANINEFIMGPIIDNNHREGMRNGTDIWIVCSGRAYPTINIEKVYFVKIYSISFYSCGSLLLRSISYSIITNSVWNKSRNSTIVVEKSGTAISNCQIMNALCYSCSGCGMHIKQSNVTFAGNCIMQNNRIFTGFGSGGGMYLVESHLILNGSLRVFENMATEKGGGLYVLNGSLSSTNHSYVVISNNGVNSISGKGGGLFLHSVSVDLAGLMISTSNIGREGGIYVLDSRCFFSGHVLLHNNTAQWDGGGLYIQGGSMVMTFVKFSQNTAGNAGGGLKLVGANLTVLMTATFINNTVGYIKVEFALILQPYALYARGNGGAIDASGDCTISFLGNVSFVSNIANLYGGAIHTTSRVITSFLNSVRFTRNSAREGGAVHLQRSSKLIFQRKATFINNRAGYAGSLSVSLQSNITFGFLSILIIRGSRADSSGGGIVLTDAQMVFKGKAVIEGNEAGSFGGAVFADKSNISLHGGSLISKNKAQYGGALHAIDSNLDFSGSHFFRHNSGQFGGGWSLVGSTLFKCSNLRNMIFEENYARQYGGAIWIEDIFSYKCINNDQYAVRKCFFYNDLKCRINLRNNMAQLAGSIVYGGSVDNCNFDTQYLLWPLSLAIYRSKQVFDLMFHSVNESTLSSPVSSDPTRVCLCRQDNEPNCSVSHVSIEVFSGEQFGFSLVGVGQRMGIVPTVILAHSDPPSNQSIQTAGGTCSMVYYTLSTAASLVRLMIYPESTCIYKYHFSAINISAYIKPCPPGFEQHSDTESCTCEATMEELGVQCDITSQSFAHAPGVWVSFGQSQFNYSHSPEAPVLVCYHSHCPLNYCSDKTINFTLNSTDKQCKYGRQGLLCGACITGYSLTLGGSMCAHCSYHYLLLLLIFAVAGVALVVFLLTLGLTVSAGTLNGLIFFANVIGTNSTIFIPHEGASFMRVFIAWLNLDLGIHTCLFPGLDMYTKVWLQFAFPLYVWVLIGVIIAVSHHSVIVTRWLGDDPVSVLATLIILSYTKLLRTILTALSFTYIQVSDGSRFAVWLYDGNVQYFNGKHIPLFLFALLVFLLLFIPYTFVLLVSPHLQPYSRIKLLKWIDDHRLKHFLRSYYAPLKDKRRSWIGLLLVVRFSLLVVFLSNSLGDPSVNLLAISVTTSLMVSFKVLCGTVYTNWCLDVLDIFFEVKLGLFSVSTLYVMKANGRQSALSNTFISISFIVFSAIILYHVQRRVIGSMWWKYSLKPKCKTYFSMDKDDSSTARGEQVDEQFQEPNTHRVAVVPVTYIELREPLLDSAYT